MRRVLGAVATLFTLTAACAEDVAVVEEEASSAQTRSYEPTIYPPLANVLTTESRTFTPATAIIAPDGANPAKPGPLADYLARGFGELTAGPGDAYVTRILDDSVTSAPAPGPNARRVVRFAHLADLQLADDESPTRMGIFDTSGITSSALRPQDAYVCHMTNAAVRTLNALHARDPISFTLMGGDNADSAQTNELDWVLSILSGADRVECDSGADDDIVAGPNNDGKDPFRAEGLRMPWKWVTGNHDILVQGNVMGTAQWQGLALGNRATGGTRNYADGKAGAVETGFFVVPDARRALLSPADVIAKVARHGDGHGLGQAEVDLGHATYAFDVAGTKLRFIVIDTAHRRGGSEGVIKQSDVDRTLKPLFDRARAEGKWVVLASHHATKSLGDGTGLGGHTEPEALTPAQWETFVGGYDNIILSMVGHSHEHRVTAMKPASGHPWWEMMTSALADYPNQFRIVEIFDQDNGWLMIRATGVDFATDDDPIAREGKRRSVVDLTTGWLPHPLERAPDKNVEVWIRRP